MYHDVSTRVDLQDPSRREIDRDARAYGHGSEAVNRGPEGGIHRGVEVFRRVDRSERERHARPGHAHLALPAPRSARPAVLGVYSEVHLAAVRRDPIAVAATRCAGQGAGPSRAPDGRSRALLADRLAASAVVDAHAHVRLASVCGRAVAVGQALPTPLNIADPCRTRDARDTRSHHAATPAEAAVRGVTHQGNLAAIPLVGVAVGETHRARPEHATPRGTHTGRIREGAVCARSAHRRIERDVDHSTVRRDARVGARIHPGVAHLRSVGASGIDAGVDCRIGSLGADEVGLLLCRDPRLAEPLGDTTGSCVDRPAHGIGAAAPPARAGEAETRGGTLEVPRAERRGASGCADPREGAVGRYAQVAGRAVAVGTALHPALSARADERGCAVVAEDADGSLGSRRGAREQQGG